MIRFNRNSMIPIVAICLLLPGLIPVDCYVRNVSIPQFIVPQGAIPQTFVPQTAVMSTDSGKICLNLDEYRSMFTSILGDNSIFGRDTIARIITWVDWFYGVYNKYKWMIDFGIGVLTTVSVFLPGGPLVPIALKVGTNIIMDPNMRRLLKEIMFEVWTMISPSGSEAYNVTMEGTMVVVRQLANSTARARRAADDFGSDKVDWSSIMASLTAQLLDLQRRVYSGKWN